MKIKQSGEKGYTLISVLIIFLLFTIAGVSLTSLSLSSVNASKTEQNHQSAFYIAEAGLNYKYNLLKDALSKKDMKDIGQWNELLAESNQEEIVSFDDEKEIKTYSIASGRESYAEVVIQALPEKSPTAFEIISTGHQDQQVRTVKQAFDLAYEEAADQGGGAELPPFAVFTSGNFNMSNGSIKGDIGTTNSQPGSISFPSGGPTLQGEIYVPHGDKDIVSNQLQGKNFEIKAMDHNYQMPTLPPFPDMPDYDSLPDRLAYNGGSSIKVIDNGHLNIKNWITDNYQLELQENVYFKSINLYQNNTLYIKHGDRHIDIVVDHLNLTSGHIQFIGSGSVSFYVRDKITLGAGSQMNKQGDPNHVNIYYKGSDPINMSGDISIFGSLYAKEADISLGESGNIHGNIFTGGKKLTVIGGSINRTQLFFAPNAEVTFAGGGVLNGRIIAKDFKMTGGGRINFDSNLDNYITGPISIDALGDFQEAGPPGGSGNSPGGFQADSLDIEKTSSLTEVN